MTEHATDERSRIIVGNFEVALVLSQQRTIKMVGYVFAGDEALDINKRIDMCQEAIERQFVRCDVLNKEAQIAGDEANLELHAETLRQMSEKRKRGEKLSTIEKQTLDRADQDIRNAQARMDSLRSAVKSGKAKLNGAAAR